MSTNSISSSWRRFIVSIPNNLQHILLFNCLQRFKAQEPAPSQYHRVIDSPSPELDSSGEEKPFIIPHDARPSTGRTSGATVISFFLGFALAISISVISIYLQGSGPDAIPTGPSVTSQQSRLLPEAKQTLSRERWSGAVYTRPPAGSGRFAATKASFLIPRDHGNNGNNNIPLRDWSAWVGLDVSTGGDAFLRMGVDITMQSGSESSFVAWYQWWPDVAKEISLMLRPGDFVAMEAVMFNGTSGKVVIRNEARRRIIQQFLDIPVQGAELRGHSAEWVVEVRDSAVGSLDAVLEKCVAYTDTGDMVAAEQGELVQGTTTADVEWRVVNASVGVTSQ
jgi:hypothetical protein